MTSSQFHTPPKPLEELIVETIIKHANPQRIFLFGSRARDDANERSDYDIAIDDPALSPVTLARIRADLEELPTLLSIDLVEMNRANTVLRERILCEGKILYEQ